MQVVCFGYLVSVNFPFLCLVVLVAQSTLIYLIWFILVGKAYVTVSFFILCPSPTDFMTVQQYTNKNLSTAVPHFR